MQNSFVRSLGTEDDSFATYRSSLRARRERLARREEMLNTQESKAVGETADESGVVTRADLVATAAASTSTCVSPAVQNGAESAARDRPPAAAMTTAAAATPATAAAATAAATATAALNGFEHEKLPRTRQPQPDAVDDDDEPGIGFTARRGLGGESTVMSNMRRSLPARMRSREGRQWPPPVAAPQLGLLDVESKQTTHMSGSGRPATTAERSSTTAAEASPAAVGGTAGSGVRARAPNGTAPSEADRRGGHLSAAAQGTNATVLEIPEAPRFSVAGAAAAAQEETREERIARYKEERRRALAARAAEQLSSSPAAVPPAGQPERDPPQFRTQSVQAASHWPLGKTASDGDERCLQQPPRVALSSSRVGAADKSDIGDLLTAPAATARPRLPDRDQTASIKSRAVNESTSTLRVASDVATAGDWQRVREPRARSPSPEVVHRLPEAAVRTRQDPPIRDAAAVVTSSASASSDAALIAKAASEAAAPALPSASDGHTAEHIRVPDAEPLPLAGGRSLAAKVTPSIIGSDNTTRASDGLDVSCLRVEMVEQVPGSRVEMVEQVPGSRGCEAGASAHVLATSDSSASTERSASEGLRSVDQTLPADELLTKLNIPSKMPQHGLRSQPAVLKGTNDTLSTHVLGEGRKKTSTAREGHAPAFIDILRKFEPSETLLAALSVPTTITTSKSNPAKVIVGQASARTSSADVCTEQGSAITGLPAAPAAAATLTNSTASKMNASVLPPAEMECISADAAPKATRTKLLDASAAADGFLSAVSPLAGVSSSGKAAEQLQPLPGAREQPDHLAVAVAASACTGGQKLSDSERSSSLLTDDDRQSERSSISSTLYVQSSATSSSNTAAASGAAPSLTPVAAVAPAATNSSMCANVSAVCTKQDELTDAHPLDEVNNTVPTTDRTAAFSRSAADSSTEQRGQQLGQMSSESKTSLEKQPQPQQQKQRLSTVPSSPAAQAVPATWVQPRSGSTVLSRQASASKADTLLDPQLAYLLEARLRRVSDAEPQASLAATTGAFDGPVSGMPESQSEELAAADVALESAPKLPAAERTAAAGASVASSDCPGEMDRSLSSVADKVSFFLREQLRHSDRGSNQFRSGTSLDAQGHIPSEAEEHKIRYSSSTEAAAATAATAGGATVPPEAMVRRNVVAAMLPRWHRDRKISKRERSQTQPVTCDEVLAAQCLGCSGEAVSAGHGLAAAPLSCSNHGGGEGTGATDDVGIAGSGAGLDALTISSLAVMTLDEKIRLFIERSVVSTVGSLAAAVGVDDQQLAVKSDVPIGSAAAAAVLRSRGPGRPKQSHRTRQQRCLTLPLTSSDMREALGLRAVPLCMPTACLAPSPTGVPTAGVPPVTAATSATSPTAMGADVTEAAADGSLTCNQADRAAAAQSADSCDASTPASFALAVGGNTAAVGSVNQPSSLEMATDTVTSTVATLNAEPRHRKISKMGGASAGAHAAPGAAAGAYHTAAVTVGKPSRLDKRSSAAASVEAATGGGAGRRDVAGSHRRSSPAAADATVASPAAQNPCRVDEKQQHAATDTVCPVSRAKPSRRSQKAAATADAAISHAAAHRADGDKAETAKTIEAASTADDGEQKVDDGNSSKVIATAATAASLTATPLSSDEQRHSATGKSGREANLVVDRQHSTGSSAADAPAAAMATGAASAAAPLDVPSYMQPTHSHVAYRGATSKVRSVTGGGAVAGPGTAAIPAPVGRHSSAAGGTAAEGSSATAAAIPRRIAKPSVGGASKASSVVRDDAGGELPSYMRATSSFAHKVEHLFAEPSSDEDDGCSGGGEPDNGASDRVTHVAPKKERHAAAVAGVAGSEPARPSARRQSSIASQQATVHVHPRDHRQLHPKQQQHQEQQQHHLEQQQQPRFDDEHSPSELHYRRASVKAEPTKSVAPGDHRAAVDGHVVKVTRSKSMVADGNASGHVPSYMRATTSYASRVEQQQHQSQEGHVGETIGQSQDSASQGSTPSAATKGKRPARSTSSAHSPASVAAAAELRAASPALSSVSRDAGNTAIGAVPSFMKSTASHAHHLAARGTHDQAKEPLPLATVATTPSCAAAPTAAARKQSVRPEAGSAQQHQQRTAGRSNAQHQHSSEVARSRSSAAAAPTAANTADVASTNDRSDSVVDKCGHINGGHLDRDVVELKYQAEGAQPSVATAAADLSAEALGDESAANEHEHFEQPRQIPELVENVVTFASVETPVSYNSTTSQEATEVEGRSFAESAAALAAAASSTCSGHEVIGEHVVTAMAAAVSAGVTELAAPPISNACGELGALSVDTGRGASGDGSVLGSASGAGSDAGTDCFSSCTSPHQKQQLPSPSRPSVRTAAAVGSRMHKPRSEIGVDGQAASAALPSFMRSTCSSSRKDRHNQPEVEFGEQQQLHPAAIAGSETGGCENEEATSHHQPPMSPVASKQPAARRQKSVVKVHRSDGSDESLASSASTKHESGGRAAEQRQLQLQQQQLQQQQLPQQQQLQHQQPSYMRHTSSSSSAIAVGKSASAAACGGSSSIMAGDPKHTAHAGVIVSKDTAIKKDRTDNASGPVPFADSARHAMAAGAAESPDECGKLTLADRSSSRDGQPQKLALLQKNANEEWKKRLNEATDRDEEQGSGNSPAEAATSVGPTSIAERLSRIQEHSQRWQQKKGQENDATQFTAEAKLAAAVGSSGTPVASSPLVASRQRVVKRASSLKLKPTAAAGDVAENGSTVGNGRPKSLYFGSPIVRKSSPDQGTAKEVEVPSMEDLSAFFTPAATCDDADLPNDADLSHLASTPHLLPIVHRIKAKRNNQAVARNPVKALSNRQDLRTAYTEVTSGLIPALVVPASSKLPATPGHNRLLAREALAGLASKENFKKVALRKTDIHDAGSLLGGKEMLPYKDVMLLQVKGRRHVQARLVEPHSASVNSGDCFLLVLKDSIYAWYGEFANVVEKNKTAELAAFIHATKDLGCKTAQHVVEIDEKKASNLTSVKQFWNHLGGKKDHAKAGPPEEDELYEQYMAQTNAVYVVRNEELMPLEQYTGQQPRFEMLNEREMLVLDFGTELYAWFGREVPLEQRTVAVQLARQLFDQGYDYSECNINPMSPLLAHDKGGQPVKGKHRPKWCLLAKVNQNMETALFREKFQDWPPEAARAATIAANTDKGRDSPTVLVGGSGGSSASSCSNIAAAAAAGATAAAVDEPRPADVAAMLTLNRLPVTLQLENSNVGRGQYWCEYEDGLKREYRIETISVRVWHVLDYVHREVTAPSSYGQFFSGDTYIVRWQYVVRQLGVRSLNGNVSKHQTAPGGRERQAYFFWRGQDSSVNQKGALALTTVELDKGDGPQVPVEQGQEPPCFLRLFNGVMAVHRGNCPTVDATRPDERADTEPTPKPSWQPCRLYVISHDLDGEACALEVEPVASSLRSRGCFVLVARGDEPASSRVLVWLGARAREASRLSAHALARHIADCRPSEFGFARHSGSTVIGPTECKQSVDDAEFLSLLEQPLSSSTLSASWPSKDDLTAGATLQRLFHLSLSGSRLVALELLSCARPDPASTSSAAGDEDFDGDGCAVMTLGDGLPPFLFVQSQLYGMQLHQEQPALLLADAGCCVYLWHGWWPAVEPPLDGDSCSAKTESALARFALERRLAAQTALSYAKEKRSVDSSAAPKCQLVYAGHEPDLFVRLFPSWTTCASAAQSNAQDGKSDAENIEDVISCKARCQYSLAELKRRPLPDDVDSLKLETYLSDGEFCELMKMTRDEYANLPVWKQANLKKEVGLF